ncbi:AAC(3) family N-acetyltransferase [Longispora fulva]|uniref:Aminoglycoside N(3)-acetyltransferase n=1 Tax=Longispora fulva TaxID=619741 RepID=A0A8J7GLS9_9ACTN|nr:AAC(3) family N-acetyltransferase [Longispora fulva]MBG6135374.1 aminoglycoside 3-N-acetyltransferase [Longispora fulva]GIG56384.1 AAC(3) family N-acetyltransferase [Longispora fulva]
MATTPPGSEETSPRPRRTPRTDGLTVSDLVEGWRAVGIRAGMALIVHSSLSSLGHVTGGAGTVVASLRAALGPAGTLVTPAFTEQVRDPAGDHPGASGDMVVALRARVPVFHPALPTTMGAIPEAVRTLPDSLRSTHPKVSVAAIGAHAADIVSRHPLNFALGPGTPFGRLHDLDGHILLLGVGHDRDTFLHHAETLAPNRRLRVRRFPLVVDGERVWVETTDVANDNGTHFPTVGAAFERQWGIREVMVGAAPCRLLPIRPLVAFATRALTGLLAADAAQRPHHLG